MKRLLATLALAVAVGPSTALAQPPKEPEPTVIVVRPNAEPRPALKYRLVPERRALIPGNAAVFYHRAIATAIQVRGEAALVNSKSGARGPTLDEQIANWVSGPIAKIPRDEARKQLEVYRNLLREVELGALRTTCDWEFDRRDEGITLLMREIQESRTLARVVALQAKLAILDGKTDEAMHWIVTGLTLGRHVSQGPTIIQALVGVAIDVVMLHCIQDLVQVSGTPSLYWAFADRPRPFIDMRYPLEGERYLLEKELPDLKQLDRGPWSLDETRRFVDELQRKVYSFSSGVPYAASEGMPAFGRRLGIAAIAVKVYPAARQALLDQGRPAAEVDVMPVVQVALLHTLLEYQRVRDDAYKWLNLPYWQSLNRVDQAVSRSVERKLKNPILTLFEGLLPGLNGARLASLRLERQLDAFQCIEAVRLHAAAHGGKLPENLDEIKDAPVPLDILTGKPFSYTRDGNTAVLYAPPPQGVAAPGYAIQYVLKLAD